MEEVPFLPATQLFEEMWYIEKELIELAKWPLKCLQFFF